MRGKSENESKSKRQHMIYEKRGRRIITYHEGQVTVRNRRDFVFFISVRLRNATFEETFTEDDFEQTHSYSF